MAAVRSDASSTGEETSGGNDGAGATGEEEEEPSDRVETMVRAEAA